MATEELSETKEWHIVKNWRNVQKEKERERRRIRDRLRRQTMSLEEREKHLARRRRNYQLRRQKVLNNSFSSCQNYESTSGGNSNEEENQAIVPVSGLGVQSSEATFCPESYKSQEESAASSYTLHQGAEERMNKVQRSPNILPLYQIRHLARLLNSLSRDNQEIGTGLTSNDNITTESTLRRGIRLIDVKRLARALNAN
ncbi:uncharacterized protein LOC107804259 isoform X2 [Nicotiana tabacum]|uniref:Uncharacterized protein LOC107804259 isoform X2 n=2 Tax=Nicotiana TaxID=4085 RepID=A0A1S4B3U7_TOBAC|nr:PREDICTED: uncharacterized protein LOC104224101 isoform X1 [Nicotiana sylvestris]XP_009773978.1 PREDICTED: uncharacterized protein LOC104224101 isoform X1 [Nicotiana sylvestris]XP_016483597.1 PREDICTED: uncharacterized protein LOC107804259 [Nicotiana tabacum]